MTRDLVGSHLRDNGHTAAELEQLPGRRTARGRPVVSTADLSGMHHAYRHRRLARRHRRNHR